MTRNKTKKGDVAQKKTGTAPSRSPSGASGTKSRRQGRAPAAGRRDDQERDRGEDRARNAAHIQEATLPGEDAIDVEAIVEEAIDVAGPLATEDLMAEGGGDDLVLVPELIGSSGGGDLEEVDTPVARARGSGVGAAGALVRFDPLSRYLREIRKYPPLERDEETRLARRFRETRDADAAGRLVTANLILVVKIARLFRRAVANVLDLIQEGNVGLLQALERFDPEVGVRFSTYAAWWIKAYILKYLLDNARMVRVGTTNARRKLLYNLNREKRSLEAAGFSAGPRLLAEKFGVSEKDVVEIQQSLSGRDVSVDAPIGEEGGRTQGDLLTVSAPSAEDQVARRELKDLLDEKLAAFRQDLAPRDAVILDTRLLAEEPATLQEIGSKFGITREAVRQAEKKLTDRLRTYLAAELGEQAVLHLRR